MLNEMPRLYTAPEETQRSGLAARGERRADVQRAAVGDVVRLFVKFGRLFGGSVITGRVATVDGPRPPHAGLGMPTRDHRATIYSVVDYQIDGRGHAMRDGAVVSGANVRSPGPITLDDGEVVFLAEPAHG